MAWSGSIVLYPAVDFRDLGSQQVDIYLHPRQSDGADQAVRLLFTAAGDDGPTRTALEHPSNQGSICIAAGLFQVLCGHGGLTSLFTFGARFSSSVEGDLTVGRLSSDAPILWIGRSFLDNDLNPIDLVVNEFQAWLSVLRVHSPDDLAGFCKRLHMVSPFLLYMQALVLAERTLGAVEVDDRSERYWRSNTAILGALTAAHARKGAPRTLPNLEMALRP